MLFVCERESVCVCVCEGGGVNHGDNVCSVVLFM